MLNLSFSVRRRRPRIGPHTAPGSEPGTVVAHPEALPPTMRVIACGPEELVERRIDDPRAIADYLDKWPLTWVNVEGLGDASVIRAIGELLGLHALALEDVANANQRPKLEEYPDNVFIIARMPQMHEGTFGTEQLALFLGRNFVVTFQERPGDCFEPVRKRLRETPRLRFLQPDYLAYALLDAIIDSYFPVLESVGERLDRIEEEIVRDLKRESVSRIFHTKHELLSLRRAIWPARDILNALVRDPIPLISDSTRTYLRDCYDHAVRIIDLLESYREINAGLMELYQSTVGHRMNEIMKVLTIIATIFIPLGFIAGLYGMNFDTESSPWNMPELGLYWGYPAALLLMGAVAFGMLYYFRRKRWIR
ncbi:MAG: magnesium/cobalt transporter CorA [Gemmatimonadota bacterium]|nr:MAG: magnesium/cobalt transporter CorA [Gemmatimonadota bacterium]